MSLAILRWLVIDTFRASFASGVFWLMLAVTTLTAAYGLIAGRPDDPSLHVILGGLGPLSAGILLALTVTAGFLPSFLDPSAALILLAKPVPRWQMFLGKFLGAGAFFTLHAALYVVATWIALGISTGRWPLAYFSALPMLLLNFSWFFSFSALLAVMTRNIAACVVGSVLFWLLCAMMNLGRHAVVAYDLEHFSTVSRFISDAGYWLLPKPIDALALMHDVLSPTPLATRVEDFARVEAHGAFRPVLALAASMLFPIATTALAAYEVETAEY